ncbi:MAG: DUF4296 domain-containing protein [Ignavibacteriaceae bacterium]
MKIKHIVILLIIFQTVLFVSCSNKKIIPQDKFVNIYAELIFAQDTASTPASKMDFKTIILARYGVTQKQYQSTVDYYNKDPKRWTGFFDKVTLNVSNLQKQKKF